MASIKTSLKKTKAEIGAGTAVTGVAGKKKSGKAVVVAAELNAGASTTCVATSDSVAVASAVETTGASSGVVAGRIGPAVGLLEIASLARGMVVCDAMVKRSPVELLETYPVTPGKYIVLVAGEVAEVEEAMTAGLDVGAEQIIDNFFLPNPHDEIVPSIRGQFKLPQLDDPDDLGAVGIVETCNIAAAILGADAAVKDADVHLFQMHLAKGIGGKAYYAFFGDLNEVQAAIEASLAIIGASRLVNRELIPRPHPDFVYRVLNSLL